MTLVHSSKASQRKAGSILLESRKIRSEVAGAGLLIPRICQLREDRQPPKR